MGLFEQMGLQYGDSRLLPMRKKSMQAKRSMKFPARNAVQDDYQEENGEQ